MPLRALLPCCWLPAMPEPAPAPASYRCGHIAIVGRPSVGKSTLLNALVGGRISITSKKPQTTRHRITGIVTRPGVQYVYVDTPGFQTRHRSPLNTRLNRSVTDVLASADAIVFVADCSRFTAADREVVALLPSRVPAVAALNKVDALDRRDALLPAIAALAKLHAFAAIVPVSAERGIGLEDLERAVGVLLPASPALYPEDSLTDRDERFLAAEYIREKVFRQLGDEVPYATAVVIESFEHAEAQRRIRATILVDKPGQRAILVGEGGMRMKAIASAARADMERAFRGNVYLEVWVRVKAGWSRSEALLTRLGY